MEQKNHLTNKIMTDLFHLNEIANDQQSSKNVTYKTDNTHLSSANLFIKALQKALSKIHDAISILSKIKNPHGTAVDRDLEDSNLLVEFVENLDLAGKIVDEFQRGTSILNEGGADVVSLFEKLNEAFSAIKIKINLFSIFKDIKHANDAIDTLNAALKIFESMRDTVAENNSNFIK